MCRVMEKHFCTSVYVFSRKRNKFLMIKHKKTGKWLEPGDTVSRVKRRKQDYCHIFANF